MSPEQADGRLSKHGDVWSFGCLMLHLSTGIPPYSKLDTEGLIASEIVKGLNPLLYLEKYNAG